MKIKIKGFDLTPKFMGFDTVSEACSCGHDHVSMKAKDFNLPELVDMSEHFDPLTNKRSKDVIGKGVRMLMLNKDLDLVFHVRSAQPGGPIYTQLVRFYDVYQKKINLKELDSPKDLSDALRKCEVGVWCSDPSFQYWGPANNATRAKYNITTETRLPQEPNKSRKEEFVICKHLVAVLKYIEGNWDHVIENYWRFLDGKGQIRREDKSKQK